MEHKDIPWRISPEELELARESMRYCLEAGASDVRVTLNKSMMDLFTILNGELDKVTHSGDRSLSFNIFADGRYGAFSTNRLEAGQLRDFVAEAVRTVRMLAPDPCRRLPDPARKATDASTGLEAGLLDSEYADMDAARRLDIALKASAFASIRAEGYTLVSEEMEYSDSIYDNYVIDSDGLECRHIETSFEIGCETTVQDSNGDRYSGYWWESCPRFAELPLEGCCTKALERAVAQMGPRGHEGGRCNMVVENEVASRLVNPLLKALNGFALQQQNSFLLDSLGKQLFPEGFSIVDRPRAVGKNGARWFDSEGTATRDMDIIRDGKVATYFINTYMSGKMEMEPTIEDSVRASILPYSRDGKAKPGTGAAELMELMGEGILVTGFNGGNCNGATGDFSFGIEGFAFSGGRPAYPVRGMVITGNMMELWNSLAAAGDDPRPGMNKSIPSLAFENVDFSA